MALPCLNQVSIHFFDILKGKITKDMSVLEFGCSSAHVSINLLNEGYKVSLLEILSEPLEKAKKDCFSNKIKTNFFNEDFLSHDLNYDFVWNSGLIQCLDDEIKEKFIKHCREISKRAMLFFPFKSKNQRGTSNEPPGVGNCKEFDTSNVEKIAYRYFEEVEVGIIKKEECGLPFDFHWIYMTSIS